MKVYIGPYKSDWCSPHFFADLLRFVGVGEDRRYEIGEWLDKTRLNKLRERLFRNFNRNVKVKIHNYDTWSMDHTLAPIILPMLKQLKETKHGSPYVDQEDLPVELRLTERQKKIFDDGNWDTSLNATEEEIEEASKVFFAQFDWILDQMIWSFEHHLDTEREHENYFDPYLPGEEPEEDDELLKWETKEFRLRMGKYNPAKHKAYQEKKQFGFTMFGKYYQSLWD